MAARDGAEDRLQIDEVTFERGVGHHHGLGERYGTSYAAFVWLPRSNHCNIDITLMGSLLVGDDLVASRIDLRWLDTGRVGPAPSPNPVP
jgi:hypothetical protein